MHTCAFAVNLFNFIAFSIFFEAVQGRAAMGGAQDAAEAVAEAACARVRCWDGEVLEEAQTAIVAGLCRNRSTHECVFVVCKYLP